MEPNNYAAKGQFHSPWHWPFKTVPGGKSHSRGNNTSSQSPFCKRSHWGACSWAPLQPCLLSPVTLLQPHWPLRWSSTTVPRTVLPPGRCICPSHHLEHASLYPCFLSPVIPVSAECHLLRKASDYPVSNSMPWHSLLFNPLLFSLLWKRSNISLFRYIQPTGM